MKEYIISCSSTADLPRSYLESRDVKYAMFSFFLDGVEYKDDLYLARTPKEFFKLITEGATPTTAQIPPEDYISLWKPYLSEGKDILHMALSSGISGTYQSAIVAKSRLTREYPDRTIVVIDSLSASSGFGMLVDAACDNRDKGMSLKENEKWLRENLIGLNHWFFSSDMTSFIRGGRVSKASGFVGTALNICPLFKVNCDGKLIPVSRSLGKKKAVADIVKTMKNWCTDGEKYSGKVFISHSNCLGDATAVRDLILSTFKNVKEVIICDIGTVIGSHTGAGTVALFFWGKERTL